MSCSRTTTQWRWWGSNPPPLGLESSTLPLSHSTPIKWVRAQQVKPRNFFIIVIYHLWPTYSLILLFHDYAFGNGRIDHFTDLLNDLLYIYYKYWLNMWFSLPKIKNSVQTGWLWSTGRGGKNNKCCMFLFNALSTHIIYNILIAILFYYVIKTFQLHNCAWIYVVLIVFFDALSTHIIFIIYFLLIMQLWHFKFIIVHVYMCCLLCYFMRYLRGLFKYECK